MLFLLHLKKMNHIIGLDIPRVLGDIIICTDVAKEQAESYNHSFERELGFSFTWFYTY